MNEVKVVNKSKCYGVLNEHCPEWGDSWTWDIVRSQLNENNVYVDTIDCLREEVDRLESVIAVMKRHKSDKCY